MSAGLDVAVRGLRSTAAVPMRARMRSASVWIIGIAVILLTVIATMFLTGDREATDPLHYDSTARDGTKALIQTLRAQGIDVTTTEDVGVARRAIRTPNTALLIPTALDALSPDEASGIRNDLTEAGNRLVLVDPGYAITDFSDRITVDDSVTSFAEPDPVSPPDCADPIAVAAGPVTSGVIEYAEVTAHTARISACYPLTGSAIVRTPGGEIPAGAAHGQLIVDDDAAMPLTVLGNPDWLMNSTIDEEGNASLVLNELSRAPHLVVLIPQYSAGDQSPPSAIDFIPRWFIAGALWLIPCSLVLLLWLGRRFGPLAVERLPVIVPAVETVHGRAALAARSHDRAGSAHILRTAALLRIAATLALRPDAGRSEIIAAAAARTGRSLSEVAWAFSLSTPTTDAELTAIATLLTSIESEIALS